MVEQNYNMSFSRIFLIIYIIFFSFSSFAKAELLQIHHAIIGDNKYRVTFVLDQQVSYQVIPNNNKVNIDFINAEFAVKTIPHGLAGKFLKAILKSNRGSNDLRMILELAENSKFDKTYSLSQNGQLFVTIEISNDKIIAPLKKEVKKAIILKKVIVMIDPGHGGIDKGAIGSSLNTFEKDLVLSYAKELRRELKKYPKYEIMMTRDSDISMPSEQRREKVTEMKADLFISLHADSNSDPTLVGASVYTLSQEGIEKETANLSEKASKSDILKNDKLLKQNKNIANVLINMVYQDTQNASVKLAKLVTAALSKEIEMLQIPHRSAELKVLKGVDTPAILIELGYLSNKTEEKLLNSTKHKKLFIRALVQGINKYTSDSK